MKDGWEVKKLGDVFTLNYGKALAKADRNSDGLVPVYGANGIMDWSDHILSCGPTLVVGRKGSAGEINRVDGDFWASDVTYFTSHDARKVHFDYLHYALKRLNLPSMAKGVKPGINRNEVYSQQIPLPPLDEQKLIVDVLDTAFEGLTRAQENVEADLESARELFVVSIANELSSRPPFPMRNVGDVANHSLGKMLDKNKNQGTLKPYLRNINVRWFSIDTSNLLEMKIKDTETERYSVNKGDLLICEGGYPGRSAIWNREEAIFFQKALHRVEFEHKAHSKLLMLYLFLQDQIGALHEHFTGTGIQHFTGKALAKFQMPFPDPSVAQEITDRIEVIQRSSNLLQANYRTKLQDLDDLRQSLLQKAFAGELT